MARRGLVSLWALSLLGAAALGAAPSCLEQRGEADAEDGDRRCATCHGDPTRPGDTLLRAAPPRDLLGAGSSAYPGVGAHAIHLNPSSSHGAVACRECHVVPERTDSPGHADDERPAEIVFGTLAKSGGMDPTYDVIARRCSDSWCHRGADAVWTEPRSTAQACGSCHGLPPAPPHPQSEACSSCHGEVIDDERRFVAPERHVDGRVDFSSGDCGSCHGDDGSPAPPVDLAGNTEVTAIGVGAHRVHLAGGDFSRALECGECHVVPESVEEPAHADGLPAEVVFSGVARAHDRAPLWDRETTSCTESFCHTPSPLATHPSPSWIESGGLSCTDCHGLPPPAPHPQLSDCARCHGSVVAGDQRTILARDRHVDGVADVAFDMGCTACHGSVNPAPPTDLAGNTDPMLAGVGAHQIHLAGSETSRAVPCSDCHQVPEGALDSGHMDTPAPAEVVFSGAAVAHGALPVYSGGACQNTACHGAVFPDGHASGGTNVAPVWTIVDGSQAACGSCHSLPPPAPHPIQSLNPVCSACHENIAPDNLSFVRPDLHVDGVVTFSVP